MTIILLHLWNNSIEFWVPPGEPEKHYYNVSTVTAQCYKKFFRWAYETGLGKHQCFQGGWGLKIEDPKPVIPMSLRLSTAEERY